ncbi:CBU_0592 family membrane protein [Novosphingobium lentum]|uniref:CBU_0592 family membrane protein n=1 Tax=Novosphingobium lentum TaxID=145287 RepID=UPI00082EFCD9|nr:hypothetical protein [Novosphingobium lentum]
MTGAQADAIGLVGSAVFIAAFAYSNVAKTLDKLWFNLANLVGAVLLLTSLSVHFNLAAFILEAAWGAIALIGFAVELRRRVRA